MKIKNMPKYTSWGNYSVNVWLHHIKDTLDRFIKEDGLDMDVDFQRAHVWTREQQIAYVEHILKGGRSGREILFNHPGWQRSYKGTMVLVDGKQRLTALLDFLDGKLPVFGCYFRDLEDKASMSNHTLIFTINNLSTRAEVLQWYLELNTGGTPHTKEEIDKVKRLLENEK